MLHCSHTRLSVTLLPRVVTLGVTGGIASGKSVRCSHVLKLAQSRARHPLHSFAAHSINADKIGHDIYAPGKPCYYEVIAAFGKNVLEQSEKRRQNGGERAEPPIDRKKLGAIVFHTPRSAELRRLSDICWPHIQNAIEEEIEKVSVLALSDKKNLLLIILEAALLIESNMLSLCDDVWVTTCDKGVAVRRVMARHRVQQREAIARVEAQPNIEEKIKFLEDVKFKGEVVTFDTTEDTVEEGLRRVTVAFDTYWRKKLDALQKDPNAEAASLNME
ncbi:dephospho-CoA kinase [Trypanosoma grayi]|uniref:dephospho-CoA kinase n=1 Tax=Trypanosoma grayi TaxID=71804 RepID=UPI0004F419AA|nr:dephospho-CoA kinase [Trypanosoma grayi]KEG15078.1 dephospho-CoA kinase [Trypanosoma grayi]